MRGNLDSHGLLVGRQSRRTVLAIAGSCGAPDQIAGADARGVDDAVAEAQFRLPAGGELTS